MENTQSRIAQSRILNIDAWSDLICPWCWIGMRRFRRALEQSGQAGLIRVVYHAYRLSPHGGTPVPTERMLAERYGMSSAQVAGALQQVAQAGAAEGLDYRFGGTLSGDTLDSHRLIKLAATTEHQDALIERLFRAYFSEQISLFERDNLLRLAVEAGLEQTAVLAVLDGDTFRAEVEADQEDARRKGVQGVPFFILDQRYGISGAQPSAVFAQALAQARAEPLAAGAVADDVAPACGPDGCELPRA